MTITDQSTVREAKDFLNENYTKGTHCPCCKQFVKLYVRPMHVTMGLTLIRLYKLGGGYHHVKQIVKGITDTGTNDFSKLRYWDLIEEMPNDTEKKTSGNWAITNKGKLFVEGKIKVPLKIQLFNKKSYGFTGEDVDIQQVLGNKFDYHELMGHIGDTL